MYKTFKNQVLGTLRHYYPVLCSLRNKAKLRETWFSFCIIAVLHSGFYWLSSTVASFPALAMVAESTGSDLFEMKNVFKST